jgi:D-inositol-3-phosphate glycosyltransferase
MRVALVSEHASPLATICGEDAGGQNLHVDGLATALVRQGHDVTVYTRRDSETLPERVTSPVGFDVVHVPAGPPAVVPKDNLLPYMRPFGRWLLRSWARTGLPDVVHAHFWMSGLAAVQASTAGGVPVVLTYHALGTVKNRYQGGADPSPVIRVTAERQLGWAVDRVVAQCPDEVAELDLMGVPAQNVAVVPSGVDVVTFVPIGDMAPRTPGRRRILTVGRLVRRKGYDDLIKSIVDIPDAELVVVGGPPGGVADDPEGQRLTALADQLGVAERVRLVGAVARSDMPAWYRSADVVACTPWYEPFGLVPLEAMACGIPVVCYAVGGLQTSVVDGVTGLHVPPQDGQALVTGLRDLLADETRRRRLGLGGLTRVRSRYTWDRAAVELSDVYADVLDRQTKLQRAA